MSRPPFSRDEYAHRLHRVLALMQRESVDLLVLTDPCNIVWISGYDAWSFYVPQALVISPQLHEPLWIGREMDAAALPHTSWLAPDSVAAYTDELVQVEGRHAADFIAQSVLDRGLRHGVIGYESDSYYLTPRYRDRLANAFTGAAWRDVGLAVARLRCIKSEAELAVMAQAAAIAEHAMHVALEHMRVGARECDVAGEIARAQIGGTPEYGGFITSSPPYLLSGTRGSAPHLSWGQGRLEPDTTTYIELLGCRYRYQVTLARSVHFGTPPSRVRAAADASLAAIAAGIETARPGATCADVANAMLKTIRGAGIDKQTRSGYAAGLAYPPTSGERTMSLHPGDHSVLEAGMTFHLHPNLVFEDWGLYITESVVVTPGGGRPFTTVPRELVVRA
jgi:ectoine hydrolase